MSRINKKHLTSAILLAAFIALLLMQMARAVSITSISPTSGPVGTLVTVTGEADTPGGLVRAYFDVDGDGTIDPEEFRGSNLASETAPYAFTVLILVPPSTAGTHAIIVNDADAGTSTGAYFTVTPQITINPTSGPIGTEVTVLGTGFDRASLVTITFKGTDVTPSEAPVTDDVGGFTTSFLVPPTIAGDHLITATDEALNSASSSFTLLPIIVSIDPASGPVGTLVAVAGTQATPNGLVTIWWDDVEVDSVTATPDGTYSYDLTVPPSTAGEHTVTAEDEQATNTAAKTFTVEPQIILSPEEGPVGTSVSVTGTGFAGNAFVDINFDAILMVDDSATDSTGSFTANFEVPASVAGGHTVTATDTEDSAITDSATFAVIPKITIDVAEGRIGTEVQVTGTGFAGISDITLTFDGIPVTPDPAPETDEFGSFTASFLTPPAPAGEYTVTATDEDDNEATATLTLWGITVSITPVSGPVGTIVSVTGTYATPGGSVIIRWDNTDIETITAKLDGTYSYDLTVPASVTGEHTVAVEDLESTNTASQTFIVEPKIILIPEDGLVGDNVLVSGTGFGGSSLVDVYFDIDNDGSLELNELIAEDVPTDEFGSFEATFIVPWVTTAGNYQVEAIDAEDVSDDAPFTVLFVMYTRSDEYFQGDYPSFFIDAADENGSPMEGAEITVSVYDPSGYLQYKGITVTVDDGTVPYDMQFFNWWMLYYMDRVELTPMHLPSDATVGTWTWTAGADELTVNGSLEVIEPVDLRTLLDKLDQLLEGQDDIADLIAYYGDKLQLEHGELAELIAAASNDLQLDHAELVNLINEVGDNLELGHADLADLVESVFDELEIKLDNLNSDMVGIEEKVDGLYLVIGDLDVKLEDIDAKLTDIQDDIATINTTLGAIQVNVEDINAEIVDIKGDLATITTAIGTIEVKLDNIQAKLVDIQGDLATITTTLGEIETKIDNLGAVSLEEIKGDIATIKSDIGTIKVNVNNINANVTSVKGRLATIETTVGTIHGDIDTINGKIVALEGDTATIQTDIGTVKTSLTDINTRIKVANDNVATIQTDIGTIKGRLTSVEGDMATLETDIGTVKTSAENIETTGESIKSDTGLQPATVALSLIAAIGAIAAAVMVLRKVYMK